MHNVAKLKVGAIGVGGMGRAHLLSVQAHEQVEVCAVCDASADALEKITDPGIRKYTDWRELLDQEQLDLVTVCLPHHLYVPVVTAALRKGLHVYKDKPFAKDLADARKMAAAAKRYGRRIFIGAQRKFAPSFLEAKKIADSGVLGKIHFVRGAIHYYWGPVFEDKMGWRGRVEESGGIAIIDSGYHIIDAVMSFHDMPASVFAATGSLRAAKNGAYTIDDKAVLIFNYADGGVGSLTISFATVPDEFRVVLHGQDGTLDITSSAMRLYEGNILTKTVTVDDSKVDVLKEQFAHCVHALRKEEPSLCDVEQALRIQKVIEAAYKSDRSHKIVKVG